MIQKLISPEMMPLIAVFGLVTFFIVFSAVVAWVATRSSNELNHWSALPLGDGLKLQKQESVSLSVLSGGRGDGCGKCENCTC